MKKPVECTHPDHVEGVSCEDRAVGCSPFCVCCMGQSYVDREIELLDGKKNLKGHIYDTVKNN
jgi:hypothetical protein